MAGSGRGRGRASFTFNIEAIGFGNGAALPDVICKPLPPFPSTDNKPVPLKTGEDEDYMLALKQDLRGTMKRMPYFLTVEEEHQDWRRLPREMKPKKTSKKGAKPKKAKNFELKSNLDVIKKIEELEKKDDEEEKSEDEKDKTKDKEGEDEEEAEEPEEYDEEEHEEENDYISSYFDDGDDFGAGSDDNMDEATY
ncbi:DNA-directed RNA polymerase III subunit RPC7 isoform X2 [Neopelma chrysocephalum]|uniref:DNA-directed RNA polymerase III subunit RPC7 isoform X2 n=1 Tax=Neopelma chrysocephalum TaxID=114329 RepID=UPI000FCD3D45|nr:DNA-directed RNA polymerase III subunit RPC7 isoform X2 [Neopelma chrysocephalum]